MNILIPLISVSLLTGSVNIGDIKSGLKDIGMKAEDAIVQVIEENPEIVSNLRDISQGVLDSVTSSLSDTNADTYNAESVEEVYTNEGTTRSFGSLDVFIEEETSQYETNFLGEIVEPLVEETSRYQYTSLEELNSGLSEGVKVISNMEFPEETSINSVEEIMESDTYIESTTEEISEEDLIMVYHSDMEAQSMAADQQNTIKIVIASILSVLSILVVFILYMLLRGASDAEDTVDELLQSTSEENLEDELVDGLDSDTYEETNSDIK